MDACLPESVQAMAQESVARSREFYRQTAAAAHGGARLFAEVAETAWGSAKLLNDKVCQNLAANTEAAFDAAEACARAGSLMEIATLQGDFLQLLLRRGERADQGVRRPLHPRHPARARDHAGRGRPHDADGFLIGCEDYLRVPRRASPSREDPVAAGSRNRWQRLGPDVWHGCHAPARRIA